MAARAGLLRVGNAMLPIVNMALSLAIQVL